MATTRRRIVQLGFLLCALGFAASPSAAAEENERLRARIEAGTADAHRVDGERLLAGAAIRRFYEDRGFRPAWFENGGMRTRRARQLSEAIDSVEAQGLTAAPYHRDYIARRIAAVPSLSTGGRLDLELALTDAFLMLGAHFLAGRLDPATLEPTWSAGRREVDMAAYLERAVAGGDIAGELRALLPPQPEYARLTTTLARLREKAAQGGWPRIPSGEVIKPAMEDARVPLLKERLAVESEAAWVTSRRMYGPRLEAAIRTFQETHGLAVDGVIGSATIEALNVPVKERIAQVIVNLERWRWLPQNLGTRHVRVNIAGSTVTAMARGEPALVKKAVVGRNCRRPPVFSDAITYAVLNPRWIVPPKLAARDILPRLREDPGYLERRNFAVFEGWGADRRRIDPATVDWNSVTPPLMYRFVQQPGPRNALGQVKIMFPNSYHVYLHGTPDQDLFAPSRRAFSAGCVRVEDSLALTAWLLSPAGPSRGEIEAAVAAGAERTLRLPEPVPVHFLYWTVWVNAAGEAVFVDDVYDRDARILTALRSPPPMEP